MRCSILLPFLPGSCLCSCASNQARRKPFLQRQRSRFLFFLSKDDVVVHDVEASSKDDERVWWEGPGRGKGSGAGPGAGSTYFDPGRTASTPWSSMVPNPYYPSDSEGGEEEEEEEKKKSWR